MDTEAVQATIDEMASAVNSNRHYGEWSPVHDQIAEWITELQAATGLRAHMSVGDTVSYRVEGAGATATGVVTDVVGDTAIWAREVGKDTVVRVSLEWIV